MGILDLMNGIEAAGDRGRARGQQTALGRLFSQASTAPREQRSGLLAQMGAISPQAAFDAEAHFGKMDDSARKQLGQYAAAFSALPADQKAAAYPQLAEMGRTLGLPVPQGDSQPAYDAGIAQLGQAFGGASAGAAGVQSTYIDAQGNRVAIMRDGSTQILGQNAPSNQIIDTGNGFFGVNKGNLSAAPVMVGQAIPSEPIPAGDMPAFQAAAEAASRGEDATFPVAGQQLRSAPKQPTQLQINADQRDAERLRLAQEQAAASAESRANADQLKRDAAERRQAAAAESANQLINAIDSLTQSPGYGNLGTVPGDIQANIPFFRNATKDADAQLKNVAGQVALATMNQLKTLSAAGATGFGSLSAPELKLLNNSIATLQSEDISHAQLAASLKVIRDKMAKIAQWRPQQEPPQSAPAQAASGAPLRYNPATGDFE
jgi:hypothetical protein